jgi:porin
MNFNFMSKKYELLLFLAFLGFCFFLSNVSRAETLQDGALNTEELSINIASCKFEQEILPNINKTLDENRANSVIPAVNQTPAKNQDNSITPAVYTNKNETDTEKNIVPVLDLKGGIQKQEVKKENPLEIWLHQDNFTGDWHGLRSKLEDNGVAISGSYTTNSFIKAHSGGLLDNSKPSYQGLINTSVEFDTKKMHLYQGGKLFVSFQNVQGKGISEKYVGDYMSFESFDPQKKITQLGEYWYEQSLFSEKIKLKIGKQDGCCEFMGLDTGAEFINSGFTFIATAPIPTYPNPAIGFVTTIQPKENIYLKYGLFDGSGVGSESGFNTIFHKGSSYMHIGEIGVIHSAKNCPGKFLYGMWLHTGDTDELLSDDTLNSGVIAETFPSNHGFYTEFEQMIFKEKVDNLEDNQGLNVFGQFGWSPPNKSELTKYFGTGLAYKGLISKRYDDVLGVGINFAKFSKRLGHIKGESVLEVFYKMSLTPWLSIQPDFQWINKPYYAEKSTIVFGIRTNIYF